MQNVYESIESAIVEKTIDGESVICVDGRRLTLA